MAVRPVERCGALEFNTAGMVGRISTFVGATYEKSEFEKGKMLSNESEAQMTDSVTGANMFYTDTFYRKFSLT